MPPGLTLGLAFLFRILRQFSSVPSTGFPSLDTSLCNRCHPSWAFTGLKRSSVRGADPGWGKKRGLGPQRSL